MSRWEFMRQLEKLLSDISPNEREEALQYYNDYFNDAGMENEQEVIKALGSPEQVAKIVKDGLGDGGNQGEFTENGFLNSAVRQNELMKKEAASGRDAGAVQEGEAVKEDGSTFGQNTDTFGDGYSQSSDDTRKAYDSFGQSNTGSGETEKEKKDLPVWAIVLIVFACILGSPVILGLACGALGLIIGVFTAVLATVFGIGLAAVIIGEALISRLSQNFILRLFGVILGGVIYYLVYQTVIFFGLDTDLLKMLSALVVAVFLAIPYWKKHFFSKTKLPKAGEEKQDA